MPRSSPRPSCFPAPRPNSAASPTPMSRSSMPPCPACCRSSTRNASRRRCAPGSASRRKINLRSVLRPEELFLSRSAAGLSDLASTRARSSARAWSSSMSRRRSRSRSASSGCIWSRTPASRCTTSRPTKSFVDLNRSGVALMEIVSKPDMRSAEEARAYVTKLRTILRYLGTCDGNMEKGSLRADVNVSVRRPGEPFGTRCEIKNVNSIRFIGQAIEVEARRQIGILEDGGTIDQETRLFDPGKGETRSMRSKEEAHDYRYFPDPDLLPLEFDQAYVDRLAAHLPELPDAKRARFIADYGLPPYDAGVLVADKETRRLLRSRGRAWRQGARCEGGRQLDHGRCRGLRQFASASRCRRPISSPRRSPASSISSPTARSPARSPRTCSDPHRRGEGRRSRAPSSRRAA